MPATIRCRNEDCSNTHVLQDGEYQDNDDGTITATMYLQKCPSCRAKFDRALAEIKAAEKGRWREHSLRQRVEELVAKYAAPPGMVDEIIEMIQEETP